MKLKSKSGSFYDASGGNIRKVGHLVFLLVIVGRAVDLHIGFCH